MFSQNIYIYIYVYIFCCYYYLFFVSKAQMLTFFFIFSQKHPRSRKWFGQMNKFALLLMIWVVFFATFNSENPGLSVYSVVTLVGFLMVTHMMLVAFFWFTSALRIFQFTREDRTTVVFTSPQKSLAIGAIFYYFSFELLFFYLNYFVFILSVSLIFFFLF